MPLDHLGQVDFAMLTRELQTQMRVRSAAPLRTQLLPSPMIPILFPSCVQAFVWALSDLLGQLDVREDIFSLGQTSRLIANQLATLPEAKTRRKVGCSGLFVRGCFYHLCTVQQRTCTHWLG